MRKAVIAIVILILAMAIYSGLDNMTGSVVVKPVLEKGEAPIILFCQTNNCMENLLYLIENSNKVKCALFDLDLEPLIIALKEKDALVIVDNNNMAEELDFVRYDNSNQLSHNKFCIFDDEIVWTGSFNPTTNGNERNDNNVVVFFSPTLAKNYEDEFKELWNGEFGQGTEVENPYVIINNITVENWFCPEDYCADHVIEVLDDAEESIHFMTFSFTHDGIGEKLIEKHNLGVAVKGVFEKRQNDAYSEYEKLLANGLDVKYDNNPYTMHHKVFIIDEKVVVTGSFNPTMSGDIKNDENIVIIYDEGIAKGFLEEFERVWNI
jgi:phosphatidylserine/phosphatidylglycerophosphate/cardiolipin synthase-like enzyme